MGDAALSLSRLFLRKNSFSANVFTLSLGTALTQGINLVAIVLLARTFTPSDFGILAVFMAITSFVSVISSWRYEAAIMLPEKDDEAVAVRSLAISVLLAMCLASVACTTTLRHFIIRLLDAPAVGPSLWCIPLVLFLSGIYQIWSYWCARMRQFHLLAVAGVARALAIVTCQLALFALGLKGPMALVIGWVAGQAVGALIVTKNTLVNNETLTIPMFSWSLIRAGFVKYKRFPIYSAPYTFLNSAADQFIPVLLRMFVDLHAIGLFSMAARTVSAPFSLVATSMKQVFYKKAATEVDSGTLEDFVLRILELQVRCGTPFLIWFAFEAKLLFGTLLGPRWSASGVYAVLLAFSAYTSFLVSWMDRIFDIKDRQRLILMWEISRDVCVIGSMYLLLRASASLLPVIGVLAFMTCVFNVIFLLLIFDIMKFMATQLWSILVLFVSTGTLAMLALLAIHLVLPAWVAFLASVVPTVVLGGVGLARYATTTERLQASGRCW